MTNLSRISNDFQTFICTKVMRKILKHLSIDCQILFQYCGILNYLKFILQWVLHVNVRQNAVWLTSYIVSVHILCQASIWTLSLCSGHSWRVRLAKQETLTPPGHLVSPLVCRGPWMPCVVLYCWCRSNTASVLVDLTFLSHLFPLPCGAGSTVPREGFDSSVIMPFSWCVVAVTLPI